MNSFHNPRCPYCGKKLGYFNAWAIKTQGEYRCKKCGGFSDVMLAQGIYVLSLIMTAVGAVFFLLAFLKITELNVFSVLMVVLPFALFFLLSVFFVRLRKIEGGGAPPQGARRVPQLAKRAAPGMAGEEPRASRPMVPEILPPEPRSVPRSPYPPSANRPPVRRNPGAGIPRR